MLILTLWQCFGMRWIRMDFQLFKLSIDWARGIVLQYTPPFYTQRQIPKHKLILFLSEAENFLQKNYLFLTAEDLKWSLNKAILFVGWHPQAQGAGNSELWGHWFWSFVYFYYNPNNHVFSTVCLCRRKIRRRS